VTDVEITLTVKLTREQVRAGWGKSRVSLERSIAAVLHEIPGDDGGAYVPRIEFSRPPGVVLIGDDAPFPVEEDEAAAPHPNEPVVHPVDGSPIPLSEWLRRNRERAELDEHLHHWAPGNLQHHLIFDHRLSPRDATYDGPLDEMHAAAHRLHGPHDPAVLHRSATVPSADYANSPAPTRHAICHECGRPVTSVKYSLLNERDVVLEYLRVDPDGEAVLGQAPPGARWTVTLEPCNHGVTITDAPADVASPAPTGGPIGGNWFSDRILARLTERHGEITGPIVNRPCGRSTPDKHASHLWTNHANRTDPIEVYRCPGEHRVVDVQPPGNLGGAGDLRRVRCSCGQEVHLYHGQIYRWLELHKQDPELTPAELATKHSMPDYEVDSSTDAELVEDSHDWASDKPHFAPPDHKPLGHQPVIERDEGEA